jgi:hypothetical protein
LDREGQPHPFGGKALIFPNECGFLSSAPDNLPGTHYDILNAHALPETVAQFTART